MTFSFFYLILKITIKGSQFKGMKWRISRSPIVAFSNFSSEFKAVQTE